MKGKEIYEGDILEYRGEKYLVCYGKTSVERKWAKDMINFVGFYLKRMDSPNPYHFRTLLDQRGDTLEVKIIDSIKEEI